jgi:hemerythrin
MAIDLSAAIARFGGRRELYFRHMHDAIRSLPETLAQIKEELDNENLKEAEQLAHAVRGRVGTLGFASLFDRLQDLEAAIRRRDGIDVAFSAVETEGICTQAEAAIHVADDAAIEWNDSYAVGVPELDRQHRELFALVSQLSADACTSDEALHVLLSRLADYALAHFRAEEQFLRTQGCPELDEHVDEHTRFVAQVATTSLGAMHGQIDRAELLGFLRSWLIDHILGTDQPHLRLCLASN